MTRYNLRFRAYGERSILIEWPQEINKNILKNILKFKEVIEKYYIKQKVYIKFSYNSILVSYDNTIDNTYNKKIELKSLLNNEIELKKDESYLWKIPVCYNDEFGLDIEEMSKHTKLSKQQIIELHSNKKYTVYFCGFLPGFLYLGGLDKRLYYPRKSVGYRIQKSVEIICHRCLTINSTAKLHQNREINGSSVEGGRSMPVTGSVDVEALC